MLKTQIIPRLRQARNYCMDEWLIHYRTENRDLQKLCDDLYHRIDEVLSLAKQINDFKQSKK